jgi:hypothetical protein
MIGAHCISIIYSRHIYVLSCTNEYMIAAHAPEPRKAYLICDSRCEFLKAAVIKRHTGEMHNDAHIFYTVIPKYIVDVYIYNGFIQFPF